MKRVTSKENLNRINLIDHCFPYYFQLSLAATVFQTSAPAFLLYLVFARPRPQRANHIEETERDQMRN